MMLKKSFALLLTLVLVLAASTAYAAKSVHYDIDELAMGIDIPSDFEVFTQDTPIDDPRFEKLGIDGKEYLENDKRNNVCLSATHKSATYRIDVLKRAGEKSSEVTDLNTLTKAELALLEEQLPNELAEQDMTLLNLKVYKNSQATFIKLYFKLTVQDISTNIITYYTVSNGQEFAVMLYTLGNKITSSMESTLKKIVDSIRIGTSDSAAPAAAKEPSAFRDEGKGISFTVPGRWSQAELTGEEDYVAAKYVNAAGSVLRFGHSDVYPQLTAMSAADITRADANNGRLTLHDVSALYQERGEDVRSVGIETVGGVEYFTLQLAGLQAADGEPTDDESADGGSAAVPTRAYALFTNGYLYEFSCAGTWDEAAASDLNAVLSSVRYDTPPQVSAPAYSPAPTPAPTEAPAGGGQAAQGSAAALLAGAKAAMALPAETPAATMLGVILVTLFFAFMLCNLPMIVYRFVIRGEPLPARRALAVCAAYGAALIAAAALVSAGSGDLTPSAAALLCCCANYAILAGRRGDRPQ